MGAFPDFLSVELCSLAAVRRATEGGEGASPAQGPASPPPPAVVTVIRYHGRPSKSSSLGHRDDSSDGSGTSPVWDSHLLHAVRPAPPLPGPRPPPRPAACRRHLPPLTPPPGKEEELRGGASPGPVACIVAYIRVRTPQRTPSRRWGERTRVLCPWCPQPAMPVAAGKWAVGEEAGAQGHGPQPAGQPPTGLPLRTRLPHRHGSGTKRNSCRPSFSHSFNFALPS